MSLILKCEMVLGNIGKRVLFKEVYLLHRYGMIELNMQISTSSTDFLNAFEEVSHCDLDDHGRKKLNIHIMNTNANEFAYEALIDNLVEPMIDFAISRVTRKKLESRPGHLIKKAREEFRRIEENKGELGELLIYCFLESHLGAPKILTKYELKTSPNMYANGSDGVHYLKLANGNYQLIFSESKMYKAIGAAITDAFESINAFKTGLTKEGEFKPGLAYERGLINGHIDKETFSAEDARFVERLIYPSKNEDEDEMIVDDAFAVFIGYEMSITEKEKAKNPTDFRKDLKLKIEKYITKKHKNIISAIEDNKLTGHDIYIYVVPFTKLSETRTKILKELVR